MSDNVTDILSVLLELYPDAKPELDYKNEFELLIAAILSAQCTDKRVNMVTAELFAKYSTASAFAQLTEDKLGEQIKSCGLYRAKAHNIIETCKKLEHEYGGQVPHTMDELIQLAGVGRKVANVVLSNAFGIPAIAVDTHVFRVANRLGLADAKTVEKTETQLMENIPKSQWSKAHHLLIFHGRRVCFARNPNCTCCKLADNCRYFSSTD